MSVQSQLPFQNLRVPRRGGNWADGHHYREGCKSTNGPWAETQDLERQWLNQPLGTEEGVTLLSVCCAKPGAPRAPSAGYGEHSCFHSLTELFFFKLEYSCFIMLCSFLLHSKVNQPLLFFSHQLVSTSLWPYGLQLTRPPCPSPTPRACSNSCLLSRWCHPTISSSVIPFSSRLQSFPASSYIYIYPLFLGFLSHLGHYRAVSRVPWAIL